jgi:hypothetical protein
MVEREQKSRIFYDITFQTCIVVFTFKIQMYLKIIYIMLTKDLSDKLERDEVNREKEKVCEPCLHHRHPECDPEVNCVCKSRGHNPS